MAGDEINEKLRAKGGGGFTLGLNSLSISKDSFHFSAAHMTVFPGGRKEPLHGHNYMIALEVGLESIVFADFLDIGDLKSSLRQTCNKLDHKLILADFNPYFEKLPVNDSRDIEFKLCDKHYLVPHDEVALLPLDNITIEQLAKYIGDQWFTALPQEVKSTITSFEITVSESKGQSASYRHAL